MTDKTNTICSPTFDLGGKKICMSVVYCLQKLYSCYYLTNIFTFLMRRGAILQEFYNLLHSSDMSIVQKFLTNQIVANEIIIVMTPYCPTHQHLLICRKEWIYYVWRLRWIKMPWIPTFSLKLLSDALNWCEMIHN